MKVLVVVLCFLLMCVTPITAQQETLSIWRILLGDGAQAELYSGSGNPETMISAPRGSFFYRLDTGDVYVKTSDTGASGWRIIYRVDGQDVAVGDGGTNISTYTTGDLLYASAPATLSKLAAVGVGQVLVSNGVGVAPSWSNGNLLLQPSGDIITNPLGNDILPDTSYATNIGMLSKKYLTLHAAELWVETLVAQNTIATIGGRVLVGPTTTLTTDLAAGATVMRVKHNQMGLGERVYLEADAKVEFMATGFLQIGGVDTTQEQFVVPGNLTAFFTPGIEFEVRESTGNNGTWTVLSSSFAVTNTTITVTGNITDGTADGGINWIRPSVGATDYLYFINRNLDGTGANDWFAGDAVFNTGRAGNGFIDLYSVRGIRSGTEQGPTIVGNIRLSDTYNDWAPRWAIGNLNGLYGYGSSVHGTAFGDPSATNITIDATNGIRIRSGTDNRFIANTNGDLTIGSVSSTNIAIDVVGGIRIRNGLTDKFVADTSGNLSIVGDLSVGSAGVIRSVATAFNEGTGYWLDYNSGTPRFRIGTVSGNRIAWDGENVSIQSQNVTIDGNGIYITPTDSSVFFNATDYGYTVSTGDLGWGANDGSTNGRTLYARSRWEGDCTAGTSRCITQIILSTLSNDNGVANTEGRATFALTSNAGITDSGVGGASLTLASGSNHYSGSGLGLMTWSAIHNFQAPDGFTTAGALCGYIAAVYQGDTINTIRIPFYAAAGGSCPTVP